MAAAYAVAHGLHLLATTVLIGFMAIVQWTVVPSQDQLGACAYPAFEKRMNVVLQPLTPVLLIVGIVAGGAAGALALRAGSWLGWLHLAAVAGLAAMTVSTLIINAPVNSAINRWDVDRPPPDWAWQRARWERGHALRVAVGIPVLLLVTLAAVLQ